jgi:RNA polymerase sigma-70 factor (ECF subfamily)
MGTVRPVGDAALLAAAAHDVRAFEDFYHRYVRRVTAFAVTRCACADDVADVVALTFVRLLDAAERYEPDRGEPAAYVIGIAANVVRDLQRRQARQHALVAKLSGRDLLDDDDVGRIDAAIDAARATEALQGAIDRVPPGEREMLRLVADGLSPSQAAGELGISPTAGRTRLSRARRRVLDHDRAARRAAAPTDTETNR